MKRLLGSFALMGLLCAAPALAGPEWIEGDGEQDAGSLPGSADGTFGGGTLGGIRGAIGGAAGAGPAGGLVDTEDMFIIEIEDPSIFCASTSVAFGGFAEFDSKIYVYEITGLGLLGNDDVGNNPGAGEGGLICPGDLDNDGIIDTRDLMILLRDWGPAEGSPADLNNDGLVDTEDLLEMLGGWGPCDQQTASAVGNVATDGSGSEIVFPGLYLIAITERTVPTSIGGAIFLFEVPNEVSGPDGPGGNAPIQEWESEGETTGGEYRIALCGTSFSNSVGPELDIKPGGCPNPFNPTSNGVLPVALIGSASFDAANVDIATLRIGRADGVGGLVAPHEGPPGPHTVLDDTASPFGGDGCDCHDLEGDGILDVMMHFKTSEIVEVLELGDVPESAFIELIVTGSTLGGESFSASDCIVLVPPGSAPGLIAVESNVPELWVDATPEDDSIDGGGFANFVRHWPVSTIVTLTVPAEAEGKTFVGWHVIGPDGEDVWFPPSVLSVQVAVGEEGTMEAVYEDVPTEGPGGISAGN